MAKLVKLANGNYSIELTKGEVEAKQEAILNDKGEVIGYECKITPEVYDEKFSDDNGVARHIQHKVGQIRLTVKDMAIKPDKKPTNSQLIADLTKTMQTVCVFVGNIDSRLSKMENRITAIEAPQTKQIESK